MLRIVCAARDGVGGGGVGGCAYCEGMYRKCVGNKTEVHTVPLMLRPAADMPCDMAHSVTTS